MIKALSRACALCVLAVWACAVTSQAQSANYRFLQSGNWVQDRNAYLLTLFEIVPSARRAVAHDRILQEIGDRLSITRKNVHLSCKKTASCPVGHLMLSETEIERAGDVLARLAAAGHPLHAIVEDHMRPSGRFQKYARFDDSKLMRAAWIDTAHGVNRLYGAYALGTVRVGQIDSPLYASGSEDLRDDLAAALGAEIDTASSALFFSPWSQLGFDLLVINQRTEASRYEPLEQGANSAAFARARRLNWKLWRYTAIVVPGIGLEAGETHVSPVGTFDTRMAARRWKERLAPFIIVSGGHVHPNRTPYSEAVEMKRLLTSQYHIPESAVVIDPYARHTTTNLRNAVRLLFRMGAPLSRNFVITSSELQTEYIQSRRFANRCLRVLGYRPAYIQKRSSPFDLIVRPNILSLQADLADPLDP